MSSTNGFTLNYAVFGQRTAVDVRHPREQSCRKSSIGKTLRLVSPPISRSSDRPPARPTHGFRPLAWRSRSTSRRSL